MMPKFEWDDAKAESNRQKHGVAFSTAIQAFGDPFRQTYPERAIDGEVRWQTLGVVNGVVLLMVAHTWEDPEGIEVIRIISARTATSIERLRYDRQDG